MLNRTITARAYLDIVSSENRLEQVSPRTYRRQVSGRGDGLPIRAEVPNRLQTRNTEPLTVSLLSRFATGVQRAASASGRTERSE